MLNLKPLPPLFSAHIELRRILTGRAFPPVPSTPIESFGLPLLTDAPEQPEAPDADR